MKKVAGFFAGILICTAAFAVDVNKDELQSAQSDAVQFENYGGPHAVIETADAITGIGTNLGRQVAADVENPLSVEPYSKYSVNHVVGGDEEKGLDADILILNSTAGVDHINNLRRIITGFLMAAYGYSREDSETLAVFITVYNAVYRGQIPAFSSKYKASVLTYLTEDSVGLSTNWEEWAGKTQIVIPLGAIAEGAATVETSEISDDKVIEALRSEDDKNVEIREKMADIKEKEAGDASEKAKTAQKEAAQEKKDGKKAEAAESAKESEKQQKIADKKNDEVKSEREQIAKDKAEIKKEELSKTNETQNQKYLTSLFVVDEKNKLYSLMTVNPQSGEIVKKSSLKQIREKTIYPVAEGFVAVCGVNDKHSAIKLCLVDEETLEIKKESEETLSENSPLLQHGEDFFVIVSDGGKNYLASFDKNLVLKKKSDVAINGASPLNFYSEGILVTNEKGQPVLLAVPNLNSVWQ
ncbi:MAG: P83/100 family protein [Treponema sp.]|uniref:P83/100 family protein n=1 Tax=Treponema sp. TaxID=166 RepID=UPI002A9138C7|nr:P83/100 family protein [Treponema sp.]MDY6396793.1 P83/100 family protein [Treponema sp.]